MAQLPQGAPSPTSEHSVTVLTRISDFLFQEHSSAASRILLVIVAAVLAHILIDVIGRVSEWLLTVSHRSKGRLWSVAQKPKFATMVRLAANTATTAVYFVAVGLILEEAGINLTAYLASASIVGLAISFGSQSLVQDTVVGLTLLFSDALDVDDTVEIVGATIVVGRVQEIGLRFTKVVNLYNQVVYIPNRTIANVSRFPDGGVYAYVDIHIPDGTDAAAVVSAVKPVAESMQHQFAAIILEAAIIDPLAPSADAAWHYVRVRFKIWPGQGALIETTFRQRVLRAMRAFDPNFADWQVPVSYRAQPAAVSVAGV